MGIAVKILAGLLVLGVATSAHAQSSPITIDVTGDQLQRVSAAMAKYSEPATMDALSWGMSKLRRPPFVHPRKSSAAQEILPTVGWACQGRLPERQFGAEAEDVEVARVVRSEGADHRQREEEDCRDERNQT